MKHEARTTLVVTAGELHDLIEALAAVEACCATAKKAYAMADNAVRAQETHANAERYMRLLRRLQEMEAVMATRKSKYPAAFYTWLESKYQFTAYQLWLMDETFRQSLFREWEADFGEEAAPYAD